MCNSLQGQKRKSFLDSSEERTGRWVAQALGVEASPIWLQDCTQQPWMGCTLLDVCDYCLGWWNTSTVLWESISKLSVSVLIVLMWLSLRTLLSRLPLKVCWKSSTLQQKGEAGRVLTIPAGPERNDRTEIQQLVVRQGATNYYEQAIIMIFKFSKYLLSI